MKPDQSLQQTAPPTPERNQKKATGLVLEGGAMRGMFTVGVCDVLYESGLTFGSIIGVSAGAAFGCNYKSHQLGRALRYNQLMAKEWRYGSVRSLLTTGDYFGAEYAYHYVPTHIDLFDGETFEQDPTEFHLVCTDVENGEAVYKQLTRFDYDALEWIRASASMPLCSRFVELEGHKLLDGGMADSIPLAKHEEMGWGRNVVVTTQPLGYQKHHNRFMPLMRLRYRRYPNLVAALDKRHIMYNAQIDYVAEQERKGTAFVIRPPYALPIGHISHDPDEMKRVYDIGRDTASQLLPKIKAFCG